MTAEIAILNKSAIALAADSLVTVSRPGSNPKTYSANKLFTLSKYRPVGVMFYDSAELLGVPWETTIKVYREKLGKQSYDTIGEYADDLIAFLGDANDLFSDKQQRFRFVLTVVNYFNDRLKKVIDEKVETVASDGKQISQKDIDRLAKETIAAEHRILREIETLSYLPRDFGLRILAEYDEEISKSIKAVLPRFRFTATTIKQLKSIAANCVAKDIWPSDGLSGVVIAGFGESEKYPVIKTLSVQQVVLDQLIYRPEDRLSANINEFDIPSPAAVCPFAQRDVVDTFLGGIDPNISNFIQRYFSAVLHKLPDTVTSNLPELDDKSREALSSSLNKASDDMIQKVGDSLEKFRQRHIAPLLEVVSVLPKEELAVLAETLVNLTSVKRKMSLEVETVGGPIDVAVISKGDGFVWIDRKHYFKPELNHQYFSNYFPK